MTYNVFSGTLNPTQLNRMNRFIELECEPMPNVMAALPNIGGALCSTPQSLADAHKYSAVQQRCQDVKPVEISCGAPTKRSQPLVGRSSPYCGDTWGRYCCLTFFPTVDTCLSCEDLAHKVVRRCPDGDFLAIFCVLHFQRAACSAFHTCILNSH